MSNYTLPDRDQLSPNSSPDVSLLLRAHAEQRWLSREVIPVVRQIEISEHLPDEHDDPNHERLPDEQLPAAIAYLEVIWAEALIHAGETESARRCLDELSLPEQPLPTRARRYHVAVQALRKAVARRVAPLLAAPATELSDRQALVRDC